MNGSFGFLKGSRLGLDLLGQSVSVSFLGRVGYGYCLGLEGLGLCVFLSFRCLLGLRGLALGCGFSARLAASASRAW